MQYAKRDGEEERVLAEPGLKADCPTCDAPLVAKCGAINVWHWAHKGNKDCDPWSEPESEWHVNWKNCVPPESREVILGGGKHRADIRHNDRVVELQHSGISAENIAERERFYGDDMIWVFDATDHAIPYRADNTRGWDAKFSFVHKISARGWHYDQWRWKQGRRIIKNVFTDLWIDLGDNLIFHIDLERFDDRHPEWLAGVGHLHFHQNFIRDNITRGDYDFDYDRALPRNNEVYYRTLTRDEDDY